MRGKLERPGALAGATGAEIVQLGSFDASVDSGRRPFRQRLVYVVEGGLVRAPSPAERASARIEWEGRR